VNAPFFFSAFALSWGSFNQARNQLGTRVGRKVKLRPTDFSRGGEAPLSYWPGFNSFIRTARINQSLSEGTSL